MIRTILSCMIVIWLCGVGVSQVATASVAQTGSNPALVAYLDGLDAIAQGRWLDAVSAVSRALETAGDDPGIVLARGVANTLAEQFPQALKDLERAKRLGLKGREATLWTYAAEAMSGIVSQEHAMGGMPRSLQGKVQTPQVVSIPGHVAQGGDDYSSEYGSFVVYELAMEYQRHRLPVGYGGSGNAAGVKSPRMVDAMRKAGRWFANCAMTRADLAPAHLARARLLYTNKQYDAALKELDFARSVYPGDPELIYYAADCWLALGRPATARREFTIALTARTDAVNAYLGRATAAARVGDEKRLQADLDIAAKLDASLTKKTRTIIEAELSKQKVEGETEQLLKNLVQAAQSDAPAEHLVEMAARVHKVMAQQRLRYDEIYQERLRVLENAVRTNLKNPDKLVDLARYIIGESGNRGEKVEPRRELVSYRWQESREKELGRAIRIADQALNLNSKHVGAMMQKALALTGLKQYNDAELIADQALAIGGKNPDALRLYAKFRAMRANQMSSEAWSLRQEQCYSSTTKEDLGDRIRETTTTTCYPPSDADLQRAAQLDAQASELQKRARAAMETAIKVTKGTVEGYLIQSDLLLWDGQLDAAQAALQQAVKLDPKSLEAHDRLVDFYAKTGQREKAEEQQMVARKLIHTTVAPLLRLTWDMIAQTAWQGAKAYLERARQVDPEDARIPAYLGVALEGEGKTKEAIAAYRVAVALEEARLRLDEPSVHTGNPLPRDPIDFGLAMQVRLRLAMMLEQAGQYAEALELYKANIAYETRVDPGSYKRQMFSAMLPDQQPEKGAVVPAPVNAATLLAKSRMLAGKALKSLGRKDEAAQHFLAAAAFGPKPGAMIPRIGNAKGDTNFGGLAGDASGEAMIELAKNFLESGEYEQARFYLQGASNAGIPDHLRADVNELNMALARLPSKQYQANSSEDSDPAQQYYLDIQRQQDEARMRMANKFMAPNAKVTPDLVGVWELTPENKFLPWQKTLTVEANANYTLVLKADGSATRGKMDVQGGRHVVRGRPEPSRGQMMLYDETGQVLTMYYEFVDRNVMQIIDLDGTHYQARRK